MVLLGDGTRVEADGVVLATGVAPARRAGGGGRTADRRTARCWSTRVMRAQANGSGAIVLAAGDVAAAQQRRAPGGAADRALGRRAGPGRGRRAHAGRRGRRVGGRPRLLVDDRRAHAEVRRVGRRLRRGAHHPLRQRRAFSVWYGRDGALVGVLTHDAMRTTSAAGADRGRRASPVSRVAAATRDLRAVVVVPARDEAASASAPAWPRWRDQRGVAGVRVRGHRRPRRLPRPDTARARDWPPPRRRAALLTHRAGAGSRASAAPDAPDMDLACARLLSIGRPRRPARQHRRRHACRRRLARPPARAGRPRRRGDRRPHRARRARGGRAAARSAGPAQPAGRSAPARDCSRRAGRERRPLRTPPVQRRLAGPHRGRLPALRRAPRAGPRSRTRRSRHRCASAGIPIHRSRAVRVRTSARTERTGTARTRPRPRASALARAAQLSRREFDAVEHCFGRKNASIALVLPARDVAETIGPIAAAAARLRELGLLDEVLVIDAASRDGTARAAERRGVRVVQEDDVCADLGPALGKGDAMWRALRSSTATSSPSPTPTPALRPDVS